MKIKSALCKLNRMISGLIPRYVEEEAAMVFKGGRLIPVCCLHEWENGCDPDAACTYRMIRWLGSDWCVAQLGVPYSVKEAHHGKEKEVKET